MKKAFTILEIVFVLVVIGIITAYLVPNTKTNRLYEAAQQLVNDIRYTQHLAMIDDQYTGTNNWYEARWQIYFSDSNDACDNEVSYTIYSDASGDGNPNLSEIAINPLEQNRYLSGCTSNEPDELDIRDLDGSTPEDYLGTKEMNLGRTYGVESIGIADECRFSGSMMITFDHVGRPLQGAMDGYGQAYRSNRMVEEVCDINLSSATDGVIVISIQPETGYTYISDTSQLN